MLRRCFTISKKGIITKEILDEILTSFAIRSPDNGEDKIAYEYLPYKWCKPKFDVSDANIYNLVVRITSNSRNTYDEIVEEANFVNYLRNKNAPVADFINSENDKLVEKIKRNGGYFSVVSYKNLRCETARNSKFWSDELFEKWGKALAQIHKVSEKYESTNRPSWYDYQELRNLDKKHFNNEIEIREKWGELEEKVKKFQKHERKNGNMTRYYGLIHGDLHSQNIKYDKENNIIRIFDFDACENNWYLSDIAFTLYYVIWRADNGLEASLYRGYDREKKLIDFFRPFMKEYIKERPCLPEDWDNQLHVFLKLKEIRQYFSILLDQMNEPSKDKENFLNSTKEDILSDKPYYDLKFKKLIV